MSTKTDTTPATKPTRKNATRVIPATTAAFLNILAAKRKPMPERAVREAMPEMHANAIHTLVRTGYISETRHETTQAVLHQITAKGREALKHRRAQIERQAREETAALLATVNPNQLALDLNVAQPRTFHRGGTYDGAELQRPAGVPAERFAAYSIPSRVGNRRETPRAFA